MAASKTTDWLQPARARIDLALDGCLPATSALAPDLVAAMRHAVLGGGKRLRPLLVCAAAESLVTRSHPSRDAAQDAFDTALTPACAVELIHAYSLIHDDLPAMDDDVVRHGQPACHVAFGEATAILAGDALQARAFELLATAPHIATERRLQMVHVLAEACGWSGMVGGQARDMAATGSVLDGAALEALHGAKTGALLTAAVQIGALTADADAPTLAVLAGFGARVGLAFQIVDDVLDATATTATLGKTAGADARAGKTTYPAVLGVDGSRQRADALLTAALDDLAGLGLADTPLAAVATALVQRLY